jgi:hypothetical protein
MSLLAQRERQFRKLKESLAAALEEGGRLSDEEVEARLRERLAAHCAGSRRSEAPIEKTI